MSIDIPGIALLGVLITIASTQAVLLWRVTSLEKKIDDLGM